MNSRISNKKLYYLLLLLILPFTILASGFMASPSVQVEGGKQPRLEKYDLMAETSGWVLLGGQLFWTSDAGQTWEEISPAIPVDATVQAVEFIDPNTGWVLWTTANQDGTANFTISSTLDHGINWNTRDLVLFDEVQLFSHNIGGKRFTITSRL